MERKMVNNIYVYNLRNAIRGSKFAMQTVLEGIGGDITPTTIKLGNAPIGSGHNNFLKGILTVFDVKLSLKAWLEWERYIFAPIVTSQSTMHRITKFDIEEQCNEYVWESTKKELKRNIERYREMEDKGSEEAKRLYLEILYNNPSGFMLTAQVSTNYMCLSNMKNQREFHRLPEWREFCKFLEELPHFEELCKNGEPDVNETRNYYELIDKE